MAQPVIDVSVSTISVAVSTAESPQRGTLVTVTGSPNSSENRDWDLVFFSERVQFNRVLKKRYATFGGNHVRNVAEITG